MVKQYFLRSLLAVLLVMLAVAGCSDPESHPVQPEPVYWEGPALDLNATEIAPAPEGKPWIVEADWMIPEGRMVTVQPGTLIMFKGLVRIDVAGKIVANGTAEQPITFTSAHRHPDLGQWRGFQLRSATEVSEFRHCIFTYGAYFDEDTSNHYKGMLAINNSSPIIENCIAYRNGANAVYVMGDQSRPRVRYNIFVKNDASAIRADSTADVFALDISYNCFSENSAPCLMNADTSAYCRRVQTNANLDSCDLFFNIDLPPLLADPENGDFTLLSCSPCIDAGPNGGIDPDPDNTRRDMGVKPYVQTANELRGVVEGTLNAGAEYRVSCNVRVDSGKTLIIPAGATLVMTDIYTIEVYGRLVVGDESGTRVTFVPAAGENTAGLWGGFRFLNLDTLSAPSEIRNADISFANGTLVERAGVRFEGCIFSRSYTYGLRVASFTRDPARAVEVSRCTFLQTGTYGIYADSSAVNIRNSLIDGNSGRGIWARQTGASVQISNTIVRRCATIGLMAQDFASPTVVNCVFAYNGYHGMHLNNNCLPEIRNTIVHANERYGIYAQFSSVPTLAYVNASGHTEGGSVTDFVPASLTCTECTGEDPGFTSPEDQHLAAGSSCIDRGDPNPIYNDVDGSRNDLGAYGGPAGGAVGSAPLRLSPARLASR